MIPHHVYYQLAILGLLWLCVMLHSVWPSQSVVSPQPRCHRHPLRGSVSGPTSPDPLRVSPNDRIAIYANTVPTIPSHRLPNDPLR
jgi:hypothetical protein